MRAMYVGVLATPSNRLIHCFPFACMEEIDEEGIKGKAEHAPSEDARSHSKVVDVKVLDNGCIVQQTKCGDCANVPVIKDVCSQQKA